MSAHNEQVVMGSGHLSPLPPYAGDRTGWPWAAGPETLPATMPGGLPWPAISIVTPSLNQGQFIEHTLRSVLAQGYPRLELIVMDGGSTDGTTAVLERYAPWLTHWTSGPDDGPADALNRGFGMATGDILGFLNADDFYLPGSLATVARAFQARPSADVLSGHGYFANAAGDLGVPLYSDRWDMTRFQFGTCLLLQQSTFFRRSAFGRIHGLRVAGRTTWDMELWADLALAGAAFERVDAFLSAFRLHAGSITGGTVERLHRTSEALMVRERLRGRPQTTGDRIRTIVYRAQRFAAHPWRALRQRLYFHSTLGRWDL